MTTHIADRIKAVFFDHDDTLVGTIGPKWQQHKLVAKKYYDKDLSDEEIRLHWGKPLQELVCLLYGTEDTEQALAHNTSHHEDYPKELFTASIQVIRHLKEKDKTVGIVTATSRFSFEHDLELHKVPRELLDYTQAADDTLFHKPDPRVFEPACSWLESQGIRPDEVLYIGDGLHDMKAAVGTGFNFLGVTTGLVTTTEFTQAGAKSIGSIADLLQSK